MEYISKKVAAYGQFVLVLYNKDKLSIGLKLWTNMGSRNSE